MNAGLSVLDASISCSERLSQLKKITRQTGIYGVYNEAVFYIKLRRAEKKSDSIEQIIRNTTEENQGQTDWTKAWSTRYPILKRYQNEVDIPYFAQNIRRMFTELQDKYGYTELDAMLVLKDILAHEYIGTVSKIITMQKHE